MSKGKDGNGNTTHFAPQAQKDADGQQIYTAGKDLVNAASSIVKGSLGKMSTDMEETGYYRVGDVSITHVPPASTKGVARR